MSLFSKLAALAFKGAAGAAAQSLGLVGGDAAAEAIGNFLADRIHDHSTNLTEALDRAQVRAWRAVELSLAGPSWWNAVTGAFSSASERGFRDQVQAFLDANPLHGQGGHGPDFRAQCLAQLQAVRKAGLLSKEKLDPRALARQVGDLSRFGDAPSAVEAEFAHLALATAALRQEGYVALATFLELRPAGGPPLLVSALRYFFQREVEQDDGLFRGLAYARLEALQAGQRQGFAALGQALDAHSGRLEELLNGVHAVVAQTHADVLDIKAELARQGQQMQELGRAVLRALEQRQLQARELQGSDSLSIRDADERRALRELVRRYRGLAPEQREQMPALLNAVGKLGVVSGDYEEAERDFREAARLLDEGPARAEVSFNAYRAALERRSWGEALDWFREAVGNDPARFSLFPMDKFEPQRILGAGGFGVAFLCRNRLTEGQVVVKTILRESMDRPLDEVFREAQAMEGLDHPSIIRIRDCDFADRARARPYFVMDYFAPGQTLEGLVEQQGPLRPEEVLSLAKQLAGGLELAHSRGILHRDIKPGNVLVRRAPAGGWECKLIDFGLATRAAPGGSTARSHLDRTLSGSSIAGTLDYAAPEQMGKLRGVAVGTYSDVFGWAKTVCFALFGTPSPTFQHWQQLPQDVSVFLGKCLSERPAGRPQKFPEVLRELEKLTAPAPRPAKPKPVLEAEPIEVMPVEPARPRPEPRRERERDREPRRERRPEARERDEPPASGGRWGAWAALAAVGGVMLLCGGCLFLPLAVPLGFLFFRPNVAPPPAIPAPPAAVAAKPITDAQLGRVKKTLGGKLTTAGRLALANLLVSATPTKPLLDAREEAKKQRLLFVKGATTKEALEAAEKADLITAVSDALEPLLADGSFHRRERAVLALRHWGTGRNVKALVAILEKGDEGGVVDFRVNVCKALAAIGDPAGIPAVAKRLTDTAWDLNRGVKDALVAYGKPAEAEVLRYLADKNAPTQQGAVEVLGKIGTKERSVPALQKLLTGKGGPGEEAIQKAIDEIKKRSG